MTRTRKPQTEAEYEAQKAQFAASGPHINTAEWLAEKVTSSPESFSAESKSDRVVLLQACEKAYFDQDYEKCLELVKVAQNVFGLDSDADIVVEDHEKSVKKTAKLERHVVELYKIKHRCLQKVKQND